MPVSKKEWKDLERQEKENEQTQKEIDEIIKTINKNQEKDPHYYDGLRDDEH